MRIEKKATLVSSSTAAVLVTLKLVIGVMSGSIAVLASAIDSLLDLLVSVFNYFALHHSERKADETFNFGRGKLEALAAVIEGSIISMSALFILYNAVMKFLTPRPIDYMQASIIVMGISIVLTGLLVLFLQYVARKNNNLVIRADALHYKTDLFTNGAILISLLVIRYSGFEVIDPILGVLIAGYMIWSAYPILKEGILMLLDVALEREEIEKIEQVLNRHKTANDITGWHFLKTRRAGSDIFISVHIVFTLDISLYDAPRIGDQIELELAELFPNDHVHTIVHMDPYDDSEINEDEL